MNELRTCAFSLLLLAAVAGTSGCATQTDARDAVAPEPIAAPADLSFRDFFVLPVGPRGLEPTPTLLGLRGQRVRVVGYMMREEEPTPGQFLMTSTPVALAELADGPADYLPPATLYVRLPPERATQSVEHYPGPLEVVGTLELGMRPEAGGRFSYARLILDDVDAVTAVADAEAKGTGRQ